MRSGSWNFTNTRPRSLEQQTTPTNSASRDGDEKIKIETRNTNDEQGLRPSARNTLRCYSSGEPGHRQTACPNQSRRGLLIDEKCTTCEM
ncbi:putative transcription factor interactor and regulator CCHC(Zn) family [Arabidopsis thaliana]